MTRYHYTEKDFATKEAAQASLLRLLEPLKPLYSPGGARVELGVTSAHYENDSIPMEAFARPLWGLAPFWAGGGREPELEALYRRGLASGTDPEHPEYWHTCRDYDQKFCEMAAVSYGILLCPDKVWEPLSPREKDNLAQWLWEINRFECVASNWQWFCILTNLALKTVGRPYSRERLDFGLGLLEDYYDGGGWYGDGAGGEKDYYNPFVLVSYGLLYAMFMEKEAGEEERCARYRERARAFAQDYLYWFGGDGASIAYGRSLTYRFAQGAFWAVALLAGEGESMLPLPVMKGLITRHLAWWLNQPIYDNAGVLTIGYAYPNLQMSETYNAPGSPYWALKCFAFLALPDDHPFWSAQCAPLPALEGCKYLPHANMLVQHGGDHAVALVPGRLEMEPYAHTAEKYSKFAYSSRFGFSIARGNYELSQMAPDSSLCFKVGRYYYQRDVAQPGYAIGPSGIETRWSPLEGIQVSTTIQPTPTGHIRVHVVDSAFDCQAYDGGFAINADDRADCRRGEDGPRAEARCGGDFCAVESLEGDGRGLVLLPDPNTNLICPKTAIPMVAYAIHKGVQTLRTRVDYFA